MKIYRQWLTIYNDERLSQAVYINLYDMHFDVPETHVFRKHVDGKDVFYYSFYADRNVWMGEVELRGLYKSKNYRVYDYVNNKEMGNVSGTSARITITVDHYILLKCLEE